MKISQFTSAILLSIAAIFTSCYPKGAEGNSDYDLLLCAYEPEYNFETAVSFVLPDTLILLIDSTASDSIKISPEQQQAYLEAVRNNLVDFGWADSSEAETQAETIVLVSAVIAKQSADIWKEWKWYEGFENIQPLSPNSRYPWYPSNFPSIYNYTKGSLLITMIDAEKLDEKTDEVPMVWIGSLNGIMSSNTVSTSKIVAAIDKVFILSDYPLNKN